MPWVVVIDGRANSCVYEICRELRSMRSPSAFWLVNDKEPNEYEQNLATDFNLMKLSDTQDAKFLKNLVADVVIISRAPIKQRRDRINNWLKNTIYCFVENM